MSDETENTLKQYTQNDNELVRKVAQHTLEAYQSSLGDTTNEMRKAVKPSLTHPDSILTSLRMALSAYMEGYIAENGIADKPTPRHLTELGMSRFKIAKVLPGEIAEHIVEKVTAGDNRPLQAFIDEAVAPFLKRAEYRKRGDTATSGRSKITAILR